MVFSNTVRGRLARQSAMFSLLRLAAVINMFALFSVCLFLIWNGLPAISWEFLTQPPSRAMTAGASGPASWVPPSWRPARS